MIQLAMIQFDSVSSVNEVLEPVPSERSFIVSTKVLGLADINTGEVAANAMLMRRQCVNLRSINHFASGVSSNKF